MCICISLSYNMVYFASIHRKFPYSPQIYITTKASLLKMT